MSATPKLDTEPARPWWRGAVVYQVYPRSFLDTTGSGTGDLAGITAKLDYIAGLGVDAVWLSPFFASPMKDYGYDVADYRAVDPMFGTLEDFDRLVERAHELGLKVVIDQVFSHTSDQHAWFQESRSSRTNDKADWYVWADMKEDGTPPTNWLSVFGGSAWAWDSRRGQYYLHNFLTEQPDLNLHNPAVQDALLDVARFWLERGVDGFRLDAINFAMHDPDLTDNPPAPRDGRKQDTPFDFQDHLRNKSHPDIPKFLSRIRALTESYGGAFTVAEVDGPLAPVEMAEYTQGPDRLHSAYSFVFLHAQRLSPALARAAHAEWPQGEEAGWPSWALSNHDAPRVVTRWGKGLDAQAFARVTGMLLMAMRGNAFLYQGEELGLPQADVPFERLRDPEAIANWPHTRGRDGARTPMPWFPSEGQAGFSDAEPWLPVDPRHVPLAVAAQERDPRSTLHFFRRLIAYRRDSAPLRFGELEFLDTPGGVLAMLRRDGAEAVLCVLNVAADPVAWTPEGFEGARVVLSSEGPEDAELPPVIPGLGGYYAEVRSAA
ncbi:alpha-glucosidase [Parvularcula dongshanensis]|uniref:Alpha-glucosidase n=1 Tax=Parvularcula dongshanensis TaxID=1173995 RepID=A0A840I2W0_9PROT|nr:alpha-glucosidase [Parvularcula dongshanensis]MBB4659346.1 alpha-glucosidase [Parvularcula dongshanensis]